MGQNASTNRFTLPQQGIGSQVAVDEYEARSIWAAWCRFNSDVRARCSSGENEEDLQQERVENDSAWGIAQVDFGLQLQHAVERHRGICNFRWATYRFQGPA